MRTLQLYGTGSATATSVATVTMPTAGRIVGIQVALFLASTTNGAQCRVELSKVPTNQIGVNGAIDPFFECASCNNLLTSGATAPMVNGFFPVDVPVRQGEIVYLHATVSATLTYVANFIFHYT